MAGKAKITADMIADGCKIISRGKSVAEACRMIGVKHSSSFIEAVKRLDMHEDYARARLACADAQFDEMAELERRVLDGDMDPQAFRAAMDARKWRLARMKPKSYGDRLGLGLADDDGVIRDNVFKIEVVPVAAGQAVVESHVNRQIEDSNAIDVEVFGDSEA